MLLTRRFDVLRFTTPRRAVLGYCRRITARSRSVLDFFSCNQSDGLHGDKQEPTSIIQYNVQCILQ